MLDIPPSLLEMQTWFAKIITSPIQESDDANIPIYPKKLIEEIEKKIAPSPTLKSEERLGIYQQQYWWRLISILQELFPSLVACLGYREFNCLIAEPYLEAFPPQDWNISNIGNNLPIWLEKKTIKQEIPLLPLAHLDLAFEKLLFAEILPTIDPAECEKKVIYLQPFVFLFESDSNFFFLRKKLLSQPLEYWKNHPIPRTRKWVKKRFIVLYRFQEENKVEEISPSFFAILSAFQKGAKLNDLISLLEKCPKIVSYFQIMAERGWLASSDQAKEGSWIQKQQVI